MAGETISLDYRPLQTADEQKSGMHDNPAQAVLYPGYQLIHSFEKWGADAWQVRRVTRRVTPREAFLGAAEEYHTYPEHYPTQAAAQAAAAQLYAQDGPGDVAGDAVLAQAVAARQAGGPQIG